MVYFWSLFPKGSWSRLESCFRLNSFLLICISEHLTQVLDFCQQILARELVLQRDKWISFCMEIVGCESKPQTPDQHHGKVLPTKLPNSVDSRLVTEFCGSWLPDWKPGMLGILGILEGSWPRAPTRREELLERFHIDFLISSMFNYHSTSMARTTANRWVSSCLGKANRLPLYVATPTNNHKNHPKGSSRGCYFNNSFKETHKHPYIPYKE